MEEITQKTLEAKRPIVHEELPQPMLDRIAAVYATLKDMLVGDVHAQTLEQFELDFMREKDPETDLVIWEGIATVFQRSVPMFKPDVISRRQVFDIILRLTIGDISKEDMKQDDIMLIAFVYIAYQKEFHGAK